jgi:penicillin-insensitive murein DD-endopeptidase
MGSARRAARRMPRAPSDTSRADRWRSAPQGASPRCWPSPRGGGIRSEVPKPVRLALAALALAALGSTTLVALGASPPPPRRELHGKAPVRARRARLDPVSVSSARASRATNVVAGHGAPIKPVEARLPPPPPAESVGYPNAGRLENGAHLDLSKPYVRVVPASAVGDFRWGLPELVHLIDRAARVVAKRYPGAVLDVGDISRKGGGDLLRHHSHESGRDADLGFYAKDAQGKPFHAHTFVKFDASGLAPSAPGVSFDLDRNWLLVQEMLTDPGARVSHIFIAAPLRARLLVHARSRGVSRALYDRAAMVLMQPTGALPHDDHMHVRISCPASMRGSCIEVAKGAIHVHGRPGQPGAGHAARPPRLANRGPRVLHTPGRGDPVSPHVERIDPVGHVEGAALPGKRPATVADPRAGKPKAPPAAATTPAEPFNVDPVEDEGDAVDAIDEASGEAKSAD